MCHDINALLRRGVGLNGFQERRVIQDAPRIKGRHLGANTDNIDVVDFAEPLKNVDKFPCRHQEGVPTGKEHVGDLWMVTDVVDSLGDVQRDLIVLVHEEPLPKTVPAISTADFIAEE